jgi:anaerobic ribonucleoside-triphosphate reductase
VSKKPKLSTAIGINMVKLVLENQYNSEKVVEKLKKLLEKTKQIIELKQRFFKDNIYRNFGLVLHGYELMRKEIDSEEIGNLLRNWNLIEGEIDELWNYNKEAFGYSKKSQNFRIKAEKQKDIEDAIKKGYLIVET